MRSLSINFSIHVGCPATPEWRQIRGLNLFPPFLPQTYPPAHSISPSGGDPRTNQITDFLAMRTTICHQGIPGLREELPKSMGAVQYESNTTMFMENIVMQSCHGDLSITHITDSESFSTTKLYLVQSRANSSPANFCRQVMLVL